MSCQGLCNPFQGLGHDGYKCMNPCNIRSLTAGSDARQNRVDRSCSGDPLTFCRGDPLWSPAMRAMPAGPTPGQATGACPYSVTTNAGHTESLTIRTDESPVVWVEP